MGLISLQGLFVWIFWGGNTRPVREDPLSPVPMSLLLIGMCAWLLLRREKRAGWILLHVTQIGMVIQDTVAAAIIMFGMQLFGEFFLEHAIVMRSVVWEAIGAAVESSLILLLLAGTILYSVVGLLVAVWLRVLKKTKVPNTG